MSKKKVTFDDIAKYTNFSKTTISRYFNNPDSLTIKNQEIIAQALVDLDYQENKLAKVLANGKSEFIGVIIPNLFLHYYAEMLNQILKTYETFGYKFLVFISTDHEEMERKYIQELLAYKIEGMIILSHTIPSQELAASNIPIVTIEREDKYVNSVNTDNYMGAIQATSLLAKNNCDILLHINSDVSKSTPSYGRISGFQDICREYNMEHELIFRDLGNSYRKTVDCMQEIFDYIKNKYPNKKKGLFMANDTHANIMLNLIFREYGTLPDEYCIIGFDDSPIAEESIIPISTVGQQIEKIAYEAVSLLVEQMNERKKRRPKLQDRLIHKKITPILIRRETTK
ncbi:MAG: LacI family transcriptional regulator [Eubacterium sp.]|jgi:LacI family sucrose operon transcriptional repressor|nr:LacI family transcriptional regulator [Eubacterium sp.]